jgi:hypothetical protein
MVAEWKPLQEFPDYEINEDGVIRNRDTRVQKSTYEDGNGLEVTKFQKGGTRVLRSVEKLRRFAFSV